MNTTTGAAVETPAVVIAAANGPPSQPHSASVSNMTPPPSILVRIGAFRLYRAIFHLPPVDLADALKATIRPSPHWAAPNILRHYLCSGLKPARSSCERS